MVFENPPRTFGRRPERHVAIAPMRPAFLPASHGADRPGIKCIPDRSQNFVDIGYTTGLAPPGRIPGNPMMLVNHQIKARLMAIPLNRFDDCRTFATTANNLDAFDNIITASAREITGKPIYFVPALHQPPQVGQADPLRPAGDWI